MFSESPTSFHMYSPRLAILAGTLPSPGIWALFPQQTCPPLSCQAKYFGWRERRREPRGPSKPIRWVWGGEAGAGRGPCVPPWEISRQRGQLALGRRARTEGSGRLSPESPARPGSPTCCPRPAPGLLPQPSGLTRPLALSFAQHPA